MNASEPVIHVQNLTRRYGHAEAVNGLNLVVPKGRCYGLFGRNGAGKTTTIKCMLNLLRPTSGSITIFGLESSRDEMAIKSRLAYVPDAVAFYPWMRVEETLRYLASFRQRWNEEMQSDLLRRFSLDRQKKVTALSKGERMQLALIGAICPEPELLILDEPTSGLDPLVRREFIQTVIGAYQDGNPGHRTILVSTHLISEFEGLIDQFTIMEKGKAVLTMEADEGREHFKRIRARFKGDPPALSFAEAVMMDRQGRDVEMVVHSNSARIESHLQSFSPELLSSESLTLEEIFLMTVRREKEAL